MKNNIASMILAVLLIGAFGAPAAYGQTIIVRRGPAVMLSVSTPYCVQIGPFDFFPPSLAGTGGGHVGISASAVLVDGSRQRLNLDSDPRTDLVVINNDDTVSVFHNVSGTSVAQVNTYPTTMPGAQLARLSDLNLDGQLDLIVGNASSFSIFYNDGTNSGTFVTPPQVIQYGGFWTGQPLIEFAVADFNADSYPDIAALVGQNGVATIENNGGTFSGGFTNHVFALLYPQRSFEAMLINSDDQLPDLVVTNNHLPDLPGFFTVQTLNGLRNTSQPGGAISFVRDLTDSVDFDVDAAGFADGDFDNDGDSDVFLFRDDTLQLTFVENVGAPAGSQTLLAGQAFPTNLSTADVRLRSADINKDGFLDVILAANQPPPNVAVLFGNGDGTLSSPKVFAAGQTGPLWFDARDLSGYQGGLDGDIDVVTVGAMDLAVLKNAIIPCGE
ncbi:MAG: VCBS repeat-containing protein [Bdellovibrionales bacterium]|nr:VCBS repeat-containing protein [Bdellovibrionales bacterium]